ncbi:MAG: hypothetical protein K8F91_27580 [Candidatus Obscuribacterales bacterium]|nr:hypothetical protein [Candidatus Obscuribacterales bacterium]
MKLWNECIGGGGPDHFMEICFENDERERVMKMARRLQMNGFARFTLKRDGFNWRIVPENTSGACDWYLDNIHSMNMLGNMTGQCRSNIWCYRYVSIDSNMIRIEHGFGTSGDSCSQSEMRLITAGCNLIEPSIRRWSITGGGQGYEDIVVASGDSSHSLKRFLALQ